MMHFETDAFQKFAFTKEQVNNLLDSALRDLHIADDSSVPEIRFKFSYDALIKIGMYLIAKEGYRVRSTAGHHVKILEKMGELTGNEDIAIIGNVIRQKRNRDLYEGIFSLADKEIDEFLQFIKRLSDTVVS